MKTYTPGEVVRIVGLMPKKEFTGVVTQAKPLKAIVTDRDPVWHNHVVKSETNVRKQRRFVEGRE